MVETQESCQQIRDDYTFFYPQPTEVCVFIGAAQTLEEALFYLHPNDSFSISGKVIGIIKKPKFK